MRSDFGPHFLVATEAEAATGAESVQLDGADAIAAWEGGTHGLGAEDLAELHCLVLGRASHQSVLDRYQIVFVRDQMHGPWLIRLPDEFVSALASLDAEQLESIGERWLKASDGFQFRQTPKQWVQQVGVRLAQLAKWAVHENKSLYWEAPSY
jgi:hypothetical protein